MITHYKEIINERKNWEKGYFNLARYLDNILSAHPEVEQFFKYVPQILLNYRRGLMFGHLYIHQSLPRMLTLWFFYGKTLPEYFEEKKPKKKSNNENINSPRAIFDSMNEQMKKALEKLPSYQFLTSFPQLISRICHETKEVVEILDKIIIKVLSDYMQQALWAMISLSKSNNEIRKTTTESIFKTACSKNKPLSTLLNSFKNFANLIVDISNEKKKEEISRLLFRLDKELKSSKHQTSPVVPTLKSLTPVLTASGRHENNHKIFSDLSQICIIGMSTTCEVMKTLAAPKKIQCMGSGFYFYFYFCFYFCFYFLFFIFIFIFIFIIYYFYFYFIFLFYFLFFYFIFYLFFYFLFIFLNRRSELHFFGQTKRRFEKG